MKSNDVSRCFIFLCIFLLLTSCHSIVSKNTEYVFENYPEDIFLETSPLECRNFIDEEEISFQKIKIDKPIIPIISTEYLRHTEIAHAKTGLLSEFVLIDEIRNFYTGFSKNIVCIHNYIVEKFCKKDDKKDGFSNQPVIRKKSIEIVETIKGTVPLASQDLSDKSSFSFLSFTLLVFIILFFTPWLILFLYSFKNQGQLEEIKKKFKEKKN